MRLLENPRLGLQLSERLVRVNLGNLGAVRLRLRLRVGDFVIRDPATNKGLRIRIVLILLVGLRGVARVWRQRANHGRQGLRSCLGDRVGEFLGDPLQCLLASLAYPLGVFGQSLSLRGLNERSFRHGIAEDAQGGRGGLPDIRVLVPLDRIAWRLLLSLPNQGPLQRFHRAVLVALVQGRRKSTEGFGCVRPPLRLRMLLRPVLPRPPPHQLLD
mmetsp:Transcript_78444/g.239996  ORF Transcript_78444/g.239996 Transcript_78444/m.239996 type:complete len:215 (+) Transcript_78444:124-768(+)